MKNDPNENKRLASIALKALTSEFRGGQMWLDCFMSKTVRRDISPSIVTKLDSANNDYIIEIYEDTIQCSE